MIDHKIISKLSKLINEWQDLTYDNRESILNKADDQLYKIFIQAEKQCRKLRTGKVDYSPELSELGLT